MVFSIVSPSLLISEVLIYISHIGNFIKSKTPHYIYINQTHARVLLLDIFIRQKKSRHYITPILLLIMYHVYLSKLWKSRHNTIISNNNRKIYYAKEEKKNKWTLCSIDRADSMGYIASFVASPLLFVLCPQLAIHDVAPLFSRTHHVQHLFVDLSTYVHYKFITFDYFTF